MFIISIAGSVLLSLFVLSGAVLQRSSLAQYPGAICSDGTPAAYYRSQVQEFPTKQVVIFLEGGGYCHDADACAWRCGMAPQLCTSPTGSTIDNHGILSDDPDINPFFFNYFKVDLPYCSSDMYVGVRSGSDETKGHNFMGRRILQALVENLITDLDLTHATRIVFGGSSAGGAGVAFNCDYVKSLLPRVDVFCVVDAAFFYPLTRPFHADPPCESIDKVLDMGGQLWNSSEVRLWDLQHWWFNINQPLFIGIARFDMFGLESFCGKESSKDDLDLWSNGITEMVHELIQQTPQVGLFVPGCLCHMMLNDDDSFGKLRAGSYHLTYGQLLHNWVTGAGFIHGIDRCTGQDSDCRWRC